MSRPRLELHSILKSMLGSSYVYFQPPEGMKLQYPCIVYKFSKTNPIYATNNIYKNCKLYKVTYIDKNPDCSLPDELEQLEYCSLENMFISDNLNHFVFNIYF